MDSESRNLWIEASGIIKGQAYYTLKYGIN